MENSHDIPLEAVVSYDREEVEISWPVFGNDSTVVGFITATEARAYVRVDIYRGHLIASYTFPVDEGDDGDELCSAQGGYTHD